MKRLLLGQAGMVGKYGIKYDTGLWFQILILVLETQILWMAKTSGDQLLNQPVLFRYREFLKIQMVVVPHFKIQISSIYIELEIYLVPISSEICWRPVLTGPKVPVNLCPKMSIWPDSGVTQTITQYPNKDPWSTLDGIRTSLKYKNNSETFTLPLFKNQTTPPWLANCIKIIQSSTISS